MQNLLIHTKSNVPIKSHRKYCKLLDSIILFYFEKIPINNNFGEVVEKQIFYES
jgi:hypothetical protein